MPLSKPANSIASAIYEGSVRHRRNLPKLHQFDFRFFMLLLDLDELDVIFRRRWFWSTRKWALCRLVESDHLKAYINDPEDGTGSSSSKAPSTGLKQRALAVLTDHGIDAATIGPVRLLTQLSYLGFTMNPVSFFYCYDLAGEKVKAIIAEVNNTPWGEQHLYVIPSTALQPDSTVRSTDIKKDFHVSPFLSLDMNYRMAFSVPGKNLAVKIENHLFEDESGPSDSGSLPGREQTQSDGKRKNKIIDVTMSLKRRRWSATALNWLLIKYPFISFQVVAGIYWQALLLYLKKIPFVPHPNRGKDADPATMEPLTSQTSVDSSAGQRLEGDQRKTTNEVMIG